MATKSFKGRALLAGNLEGRSRGSESASRVRWIMFLRAVQWPAQRDRRTRSAAVIGLSIFRHLLHLGRVPLHFYEILLS